MSTLIEIRNLSKVYERGAQKIEALHHVNLDITKGDFLALMGPSGSGKTTLLNLIGGLDSPTDGSITFDGGRIDRLGESALAKWRASNVGFVFQFYNLLPMLSAQKNVQLPLLLTKLSAAHRKRNAGIALKLVGLSERAAHKPGELSGGQQQRVAIARAIAKKPEVLLCDEPTGALDAQTGAVVLEVIDQVNRELRTTTVLITHNVVIAGMADRVIHFRDGLVASCERNPSKISPSELRW